jgi:hypothetical protein
MDAVAYTTNTKIDLIGGKGEIFRFPPFLKHFRFRPDFPDEFERCIGNAGLRCLNALAFRLPRFFRPRLELARFFGI